MDTPRRSVVLAAALPLVLGFGPLPSLPLDAPSVPIVSAADDDTFTTPNVTPVGLLPEPSIISVAFASDAPLMYASTLTGVRTYDISDPTMPQLLGLVPIAVFQNENVKLGEREDGTKFVLVGFDTVGLTPTTDPTDVGTFDEIAVVDVTDPTAPYVRSRVEVGSDTHTVGCANDACTHAYSSGRGGAFDIVDLSDLDAPEPLGQLADQPMEANAAFGTGIGHDWDVDAAGVAWWVGTGGIVAYDVADPARPQVLNSSDANGRDPEWNNFISHNSLRPNADRFGVSPGDQDDPITPPTSPGRSGDAPGRTGEAGQSGQRPGRSGDAPGRNRAGTAPGDGTQDTAATSSASLPDGPHVDRGDVLLLTEEDYIDVTCASEGSFQTWHVPDLASNPDGVQDGGTITPLDQWNTELLGTGVPTPAGAFCSAHYFDYHQDGYVAQGWYQQGLRILDVNDPTAIRQVGYWITGAQETWGAKWVPEYDQDGVQTGDKLDLIYTQDPTRGIEILAVDLPEERGAAPTVTAPVLASWLVVPASVRMGFDPQDAPFGWACRLPVARLER